MMTIRRLLSCAVLLTFLVSLRAADGTAEKSASWTHWRGPSGQGYTDDTRVPLSWSETENVRWKTALPGHGNSSPIIWGERIFLTAASKDGDERYVVCIRTADGKILWQRTVAKGVPKEKTHPWNGYASPSCATDGTCVLSFFGTAGLFCHDFEGNLQWHHDFGIFTSEAGWGTAASPILFEDLVIQNCDNDGAKALPAGHKATEAAPMALVALDKKTGKVRWQTPRDQGRGFSTPRLLTSPAGKTELILNGPLGVWSYDPASGKELWHCSRTDPKDLARFGEPIPISSGETLFVESGRPGPMQAIRLGGKGDVTRTNILWEIERKGHRDVASQIVIGEHIYSADNKGVLSCIEARTGKELYTQRMGGDRAKPLASPITLHGKILYLLDDGVAVLLEPGPVYKEIRRNKLGDGSALDFGASPAVADGKLYLRSQEHLYCIGVRK